MQDKPSHIRAAEHKVGNSKSAFEELVRHNNAQVFGYLGRMGFDQSAAEDLAQETFLRAWRARTKYDASKAGFTTWVLAIARNLAINEFERRSRQAAVPTDPSVLTTTMDASTAVQGINEVETVLAMRQALLSLTTQERDVLALAYIQGLSSAQAASLAGCSEAAYRTRVSRARAALVALLEN